MSKNGIIKQLPKINQRERCEIEDGQKILLDSDQRANERFLRLDDLEAKHGKAKSR